MNRRIHFSAFLLIALGAAPVWADVPAADAKPAAAAAKVNLLKPVGPFGPWVLQINGDGRGAMWAIDKTLLIITSAVTEENWHVQCFYPGLDLEQGREYVLKFQAKSPESTATLLTAQLDQDPWNEVGLHEELKLTPNFQKFEFKFVADGVAPKACRLGFAAGFAKGIIYVKDLSLTTKS